MSNRFNATRTEARDLWSCEELQQALDWIEELDEAEALASIRKD